MPTRIPSGPLPGGLGGGGSAPDRGKGEREYPEATALVRIVPDGSFTVQLHWLADDTLVRLDLDASAGRCSLLRLRGRAWLAADVGVTREAGADRLTLATRAARSAQDGAVEARSLLRAPGGRRVERRLDLDPTGTWQAQYDDRRRSGMRIVGDAQGRTGPEAVTQFTRRRIEPNGAEAWFLTAETRPAGADDGAAPRPAAGFRPAMLTVSHVRYAAGGTGTYRLLSYEEKYGPVQLGQGSWRVVPSGPGSHASSQTTIGPDGTVNKTTITSHDNGGWTIETEKHGPLNPGTGTQRTEATWTQLDANGQKTSIHTEKVTTIDRKSQTDTWHTTTIGSDGKKTSERGVTVTDLSPGAPGGQSTTLVVHNPDGSTTIITVTTDANGNGTRHTTTVDKNGNVITDSTTQVGSGTSPPPSDEDDDDDADDDADDDSDDDDSDDDDSDDDDSDDDDSDDDDSDDDDGGDDDTGDDGGDDGMGWDGTDEGPPDIMPKRPADIWAILADPQRGLESESDDPIGDRIARALQHGAVVIPGRVGDTGWGEATGSESLPEIVLTPATIVTVGRVPTPTEDWGDWNDPRVHVAYAARLMDALAHHGEADVVAVTRAARAVSGLGALISRAGATR